MDALSQRVSYSHETLVEQVEQFVVVVSVAVGSDEKAPQRNSYPILVNPNSKIVFSCLVILRDGPGMMVWRMEWRVEN